MVLPPMVYKSDDRETIAHFRTVAKATNLPIMVYNNPPAYKVDITPEMFVEMADEPKFACIKESSDNPRRVTDIINLTKDRYVLFAGVDDLFLECMMLSGRSWAIGPSECVPAREPLDLGSRFGWKVERSSGDLSLVHALIAPGYAHQVGAIYQTRRSRMWIWNRTLQASTFASGRC